MTATKKLRQHPKPPTRSALARPSGSASYPLWKHMHDNHGLIMLESEMDDMLQVADEMNPIRCRDVAWYGPHPCEKCGKTIVRASRKRGGLALDAPHDHHYPNHQWQQHVCTPNGESSNRDQKASTDAH